MSALLLPGKKSPDVLILRSILNAEGYRWPGQDMTSQTYDTELQKAVWTFQSQHRNQQGEHLDTDRKVGTETWWALHNPAGPAQKNPSAVIVPPAKTITTTSTGLAAGRVALIAAAVKYLKAPTKEIPNGSNWGGLVSEILKHAGGPRPWCAHFVCHCYKEATGGYPWGKDQGLVAGFWADARTRSARYARASSYIPRPGDFGVMLYGNTGTGHIFIIVSVAKTANGYAFNTIEGNMGNAVRLSTRYSTGKDFVGYINPWGDAAEPYTPGGLTFTPDEDADKHSTR